VSHAQVEYVTHAQRDHQEITVTFVMLDTSRQPLVLVCWFVLREPLQENLNQYAAKSTVTHVQPIISISV
jgi:hypothetical protein